MRKIQLILCLFIYASFSYSQDAIKDSLETLNRTKNIISICEKIDFTDPNILKLGVYYKAAELITVNGYSKANYTKKNEKVYVDSLCKKINSVLGTNKEWAIWKYTSKSATIHIQELKYRNSIYDVYSILKLVFIKKENDFFLMGLE